MTPHARNVVIGVGALALAIAVGLLLALGLRTLTAAQDPPPGSAAPAPPPAATPAPAAPAAPVSEPRPDPGRNECVDELGDGPVDLDSAQLELHDGDLVAQFRIVSGLPAGEVALGLSIERNGDKVYLLGVSLRDGEVEDVFVQDLDREDREDLDEDAVTIDEGVVTVVFERDAIKRIGNDWRWYAFTNVPGGALDACPGPADDPAALDFER